MRKLMIAAHVTADGVMQAPGGPQEDRDGGFAHGGWTVPYWDEELSRLVMALIQRAGALMLGRRTYEIFTTRFPDVDDDPFAARFQALPKYVASTTLEARPEDNITLLNGNLIESVERLKAGAGGDIWMIGSWSLIQPLAAHDLVDEYHLWTFPIVVGGGKRLFGEGARPACLQLIESRTSRTGVVMSRYERIGHSMHRPAAARAAEAQAVESIAS